MTETEELLQAIARALDDTLNGVGKAKKRSTAFVVLLAPFDAGEEGARVNYVSNANRFDIALMLKEIVERFGEVEEGCA